MWPLPDISRISLRILSVSAWRVSRLDWFQPIARSPARLPTLKTPVLLWLWRLRAIGTLLNRAPGSALCPAGRPCLRLSGCLFTRPGRVLLCLLVRGPLNIFQVIPAIVRGASGARRGTDLLRVLALRIPAICRWHHPETRWASSFGCRIPLRCDHRGCLLGYIHGFAVHVSGFIFGACTENDHAKEKKLSSKHCIVNRPHANNCECVEIYIALLLLHGYCGVLPP